jgi:agmatinase
LTYYLQTSTSGALVDMRSGRELTYDPDDARLVDLSDVAVHPLDAKQTAASIEAVVTAIGEQGAVPLMLGGDHYVSYPAVKAFVKRAAANGRRPGYIQFDAHFDLTDSSPIFGTHYHGSVTRRILDLPEIANEDVTWIGVNGYARREQIELANDFGATTFDRNQIRDRGIAAVMTDAVGALCDRCDCLYVSIDIDVVDASLAPGTGSINLDGISTGELLAAVDHLVDAPVEALDIVEVSPDLDPTGVTSRLAAVCLMNFTVGQLSGRPRSTESTGD